MIYTYDTVYHTYCMITGTVPVEGSCTEKCTEKNKHVYIRIKKSFSVSLSLPSHTLAALPTTGCTPVNDAHRLQLEFLVGQRPGLGVFGVAVLLAAVVVEVRRVDLDRILTHRRHGA